MANAFRYFGAFALIVALTPFTSAQDCRSLPTTDGLVPAECAQSDATPDAPPAAEAPGDIFGFDAVNGFLGTQVYTEFGKDAPNSVAVINPDVQPVSFINGGDFPGNDLSTWFAVDFAGNTYAIDPTDGSGTTPTGNTGGQAWGDAAYNNADGLFYAITAVCGTSTTLWTVDFGTSTATQLGTTTDAPCSVGLAIDDNGNIYYHDIVTDAIHGPVTGGGTSAPQIGAGVGFDANFAQSMDFNKDSGVLYLCGYDLNLNDGVLYTVNTGTGAGAFIGTIDAAVQREITACSSQTVKDDGCSLAFVPPIIIDPPVVPRGGNFKIRGQVANNGPGVKRVSITLRYNRKVNGQPGPPMGSIRFGPASVPPGVVNFALQLRVNPQAPLGLYNIILELEDKTDGGSQICDTFRGQVEVVPPPGRVSQADGDEAVEVFEATADGLAFSAAAEIDASSHAPVAVSPNPFARQTTISYEVAAAADVRLAVYDVLGREVAVLVDARQEAGTHSAVFNASDLAAGTYVYRLQVGTDVRTGRMTLAR
ncbi:MAG: T9SS type A sorting domain-containing protein [Rubricoccaceae bacterium]|nr:T9SS type A sorting domain-containing protein [Rubricoccaceae bacterium]